MDRSIYNRPEIHKVVKIPIDIGAKQLLVIRSNNGLTGEDIANFTREINAWLVSENNPVMIINIKAGMKVELIKVSGDKSSIVSE